MLYVDGLVTAAYKKAKGQNEDGREYGGNWCFELQEMLDVKGGEGKRPDRFTVNTPLGWGDMQDMIGKRITPIPVRKSVFEGKVFFSVLDNAPKPTAVVDRKAS